MDYGKHMSAEEIADFFAPHLSTTDAVTEWLVSSGISADRFAISVNKQVISSPASYETSRMVCFIP
jgi:tripeptidyl-peptidase I